MHNNTEDATVTEAMGLAVIDRARDAGLCPMCLLPVGDDHLDSLPAPAECVWVPHQVAIAILAKAEGLPPLPQRGVNFYNTNSAQTVGFLYGNPAFTGDIW